MKKFLSLLCFVLFPATVSMAQTVSADRFELTGPCVSSAGSGSPNSAVTGSICDYYIDTATSNLYRKKTGTATNTGWEVVPMVSLTNTWTATQTFTASIVGAAISGTTGNFSSLMTVNSIALATTLGFGASADAILQGSTDVIEQYRSTNPQRFNVYNTRTSSTNKEFGYLWFNSNNFRLGTDKGSGGGTFRDILLEPGAVTAVTLSGTTQAATFAGQINAAAAVYPTVNMNSPLGDSAVKWKYVAAGELHVGTIVSQNTVATIGGRIIAAPANFLTASSAAISGTITVKYNNLTNGDRIYFESNGAIEWMAVNSAAGGSAGLYTYSVIRNLDGSGADAWDAGESLVDTGTIGSGYLDIFSNTGVLSGTGPTIIGNVRTGTTYSQIAARWAIGNLKSIYGYAATDTYGAAFGDASATNITIDATNGFRIRSGTTDKLKADTSGNLSLTGSLAITGSGAMTAGGVSVDASGLFISPIAAGGGGTYANANAVRWTSSTTNRTAIWRSDDTSGSPFRYWNFDHIEDGPSTPETRTTHTTSQINSGSENAESILFQRTTVGNVAETLITNRAIGIGATNRYSYLYLGVDGDSSVLREVALGIGTPPTPTGTMPTIPAFTTGIEMNSTGLYVTGLFQTQLDVTNGTTTTTYQAGFFGTSSAHNQVLLAGNATIETLCNGGGITVGAPTGGCKGAGTVNISADIYKNNTAYTNPDYVFEHWATGKIEKFAQNEGASDYKGLMPLDDLRKYVHVNYRFPTITDKPVGAFGRNDIALSLTEQNTLYIFQLLDRIKVLEQTLLEKGGRQ